MDKRFQRVAVLMGGPSEERDVSLSSGMAVARALATAGYEVTEIDIMGRDFEVADNIEAVFVALHGEFGEDGQIQALLDERELPYTGSGPAASRVAFDKVLSKETFINKDIPTPKYEVLNSDDVRKMALPVVIKPACQGSSIGVHRVLDEEDWEEAALDTLLYGREIIVEEYIRGREITVGIVGDTVLPVVEVVAPNDWYSYKAKYTKGASNYLIPAPMDEELADSCQELAKSTFDALGCRGFARVDFRVSQDGDIYVLELNTIPGFTETSLLPKAAAEITIEFPDLCEIIMESATNGEGLGQ